MAGVILKIKESMNSFSPSEHQVGEYILSHLNEIDGLSIYETAEKAQSSTSAVMRFCRTLGYSGFRNFSLELTKELVSEAKNQPMDYADIRVGDNRGSIIKNICRNNMQAIDDTLAVIDHSQIDLAVQALKNAKRIDFYGYGASAIVAMDAQQKFMRINRFATAHEGPHLQIVSASTLGPEGVAVAISASGETKEIIEAALAAKESGATVIAITKFSKNDLQKVADIKLSMRSPEIFIRSAAMSSRIAQLTVIDILYSIIVSEEYEKIHKYLDVTRISIARHRYMPGEVSDCDDPKNKNGQKERKNEK
ncbi:MAG: MurR/RpiR family transcriptional regulator [Treponema sp.]|jgi:DNA-binding MurR/RpiR family transcriptional regulator|nr:MurR/RpiR family transcriptional regulator [Treponema sp.]